MNRSLLVLTLAFSLLSACGNTKRLGKTSSAQNQNSPETTSFATFKKLEQTDPAFIQNAARVTTTTCASEGCKEFREEFRYVVYVGKQIYCYWEEKKAETKTDFDALALELETSITDSTSFSEYFLAIRRWASAFHDGHVNAMTGTDMSKLEIYSSLVRLELFQAGKENEQVIVSAVGAVRGPISRGDKVIEVNGKPVKEALTEVTEKYSSGSTVAMRRSSAARRLVDVIGSKLGNEPFFLKVLHNGKEEVVNIPRKLELNLPPDPSKKEEVDDIKGSITATVLAGGIGYLKIDIFAGDMGKLIDLAMNRLLPSKGLVIDMRENGGGDQSGSKIISRLIQSSVVRYKVSPRNSDYLLALRPYYFLSGIAGGLPFAPWQDVSVSPSGEDSSYRGKPVVVLTSNFCFSACDTFVSGMKANKLATIVGEATGGGTGSPLVFKLPSTQLQFRYSVVRGLTANNEVLEGAGTQPDVLVEALPDDRLAGTDKQLDTALKIISEKLGATPPPLEDRPALVLAPSLDRSPTAQDELLLKRLSKTLEY